jgi:hypothetical protein
MKYEVTHSWYNLGEAHTVVQYVRGLLLHKAKDPQDGQQIVEKPLSASDIAIVVLYTGQKRAIKRAMLQLIKDCAIEGELPQVCNAIDMQGGEKKIIIYATTMVCDDANRRAWFAQRVLEERKLD